MLNEKAKHQALNQSKTLLDSGKLKTITDDKNNP